MLDLISLTIFCSCHTQRLSLRKQKEERNSETLLQLLGLLNSTSISKRKNQKQLVLEKALVMDQVPSPKNTNQGLLSCWGCLKLKLPWTARLRRYTNTRQRSIRNPGAGFRYDPLSYAQNFDDGWDEMDEDSSKRGFSARYAAPSFNSSGNE